MNILACLFTLVMAGALAYHLYVVKDEPLLAFAAVILFAWTVPMAWVAKNEDQEIMGGK